MIQEFQLARGRSVDFYKGSQEVELGATQNNISWRSEWHFNFGPLDFKSSALTTWPCCLGLLFKGSYSQWQCKRLCKKLGTSETNQELLWFSHQSLNKTPFSVRSLEVEPKSVANGKSDCEIVRLLVINSLWFFTCVLNWMFLEEATF